MRTTKKLHIEFTKGAEASFSFLPEKVQTKAKEYLSQVAECGSFSVLKDKCYKLPGAEDDLFAIKINSKLRLIVQLKSTRLLVLDVLNHDLFLLYFKAA